MARENSTRLILLGSQVDRCHRSVPGRGVVLHREYRSLKDRRLYVRGVVRCGLLKKGCCLRTPRYSKLLSFVLVRVVSLLCTRTVLGCTGGETRAVCIHAFTGVWIFGVCSDQVGEVDAVQCSMTRRSKC